MKEDFLYYLWTHRLFDQEHLKSSDGEAVEIVFPGFRNDYSGPDFAQARIKIGDTLWVGNVEIHVSASDWYLHGHQGDINYSKIILHVVYEDDLDHNVSNAPTLELMHRIPKRYMDGYTKLIKPGYDFMACEKDLVSVPEIKKVNWVEKMYLRRLERKVREIALIKERYDGNWDQLLFIMLARAFGAKVNGGVLEQWACSIPWEKIQGPRLGDHLEALAMGLFGVLEQPEQDDDYVHQYKKEYRLLREQLGLNFELSGLLKFYPVRPDNFPTLRLAQLAAIYRHKAIRLSDLVSAVNLDQMRAMLDMELSDYWDDHYIPGKQATRSYPKILTASFINQVLINALIPVYFSFWKDQGQLQRAEAVLDWMGQLPAERNSTVEHFSALKWKSKTALESQGLLEMHQHYCSALKCMECPIAGHLLRQTSTSRDIHLKQAKMSVLPSRRFKPKLKGSGK